MKIKFNSNREYELVCSFDELFEIQTGLELRKNNAVQFQNLATHTDSKWVKAYYDERLIVLNDMLNKINF